MNSIQPSRLLKTVLIADAAVSAAAAALQLAAPGALSGLLQLPRVLLVDTGVFLAAYVVLLVAMARAPRVWSALAWLVVLGNVGWAIGCLALAASSIPGALGVAFLVAQAVAVLAFAVLEYRGLKASSPAGGGARPALSTRS